MSASPAELQLQVFVSPTHPIGNDGLTFSPTTSTLIYGEREAILVDAQFIKNDIVELGNLIEELGKTLTTIFITHGHAIITTVLTYWQSGFRVSGWWRPPRSLPTSSSVVSKTSRHSQPGLATISLSRLRFQNLLTMTAWSSKAIVFR